MTSHHHSQPGTTSDAPITREEMIEMFGDEAPIEAINLIWNAPDDKTLADIRRELREIAAKKARVAHPHIGVQSEDAMRKALEQCRTSYCGYAITNPDQYPEVLANFWKEIQRIDRIARSALALSSAEEK